MPELELIVDMREPITDSSLRLAMPLADRYITSCKRFENAEEDEDGSLPVRK
jgi:hypothetical protein